MFVLLLMLIGKVCISKILFKEVYHWWLYHTVEWFFICPSLSLFLSSVLDEEEGESFEFDDEAPEAERPPSFPPALDFDSSGCPVLENAEADLPPPPPPQTCSSAPHGQFPPPPEEGHGADKELPPPPEGADTQGMIMDLLLLLLYSGCELYTIYQFFSKQ